MVPQEQKDKTLANHVATHYAREYLAAWASPQTLQNLREDILNAIALCEDNTKASAALAELDKVISRIG